MNYHNITSCDMNNGEGLRVVLWVAGCDHKCKSCHNPQTWLHESGILFDENTIDELCNELDKDYHKGITFSGGDPLSISNKETITQLAEYIKILYPHKDVWCYTGFNWEDVKELSVMGYIDVLVDGRFVEGMSMPSPKWCGSSNQRVIDVKKSLQKGEVVLYDSTELS